MSIDKKRAAKYRSADASGRDSIDGTALFIVDRFNNFFRTIAAG
jgi:hypothetical protein